MRSVKTVPCRTQEWDFCYNPYSVTVSPAERCDFVGVKLEKVHELSQVCRICGKEWCFIIWSIRLIIPQTSL